MEKLGKGETSPRSDLDQWQAEIVCVWHKVYDDMVKTWGVIPSADRADKSASALSLAIRPVDRK